MEGINQIPKGRHTLPDMSNHRTHGAASIYACMTVYELTPVFLRPLYTNHRIAVLMCSLKG